MNTEFSFKFKEKALAEHDRLSRLFRENRFLFELERKQAIEQTINRSEKPHLKEQLTKIQARWDNTIKHSGADQNRLVLAQMLLWESINDQWLPVIQKVSPRK